MFIFDLHVHTKEVSPCGSVPAKQLVQLYQQGNYTGFVITDHFYNGFVDKNQDLDWNLLVDEFYKGFESAKSEGEKTGFTVIPGMELRFRSSMNDFLVIGLEPETFKLKEFEDIIDKDLSYLHTLAEKYSFLVYQAHPFRHNYGSKIDNIAFLDGIEAFNKNPRHNSENQMAYDFSLKYQLKIICGSDCHQTEDVANGGMLFRYNPKSSKELVTLLKGDSWKKLLI